MGSGSCWGAQGILGFKFCGPAHTGSYKASTRVSTRDLQGNSGLGVQGFRALGFTVKVLRGEGFRGWGLGF